MKPNEKGYVKIVVHKGAYLNDCRYCIYLPACKGIEDRRGKLAELGCMILNWNEPKKRGEFKVEKDSES